LQPGNNPLGLAESCTGSKPIASLSALDSLHANVRIAISILLWRLMIFCGSTVQNAVVVNPRQIWISR
jgi:hypothetical protein